jgi:hypothetical protein
MWTLCRVQDGDHDPVSGRNDVPVRRHFPISSPRTLQTRDDIIGSLLAPRLPVAPGRSAGTDATNTNCNHCVCISPICHGEEIEGRCTRWYEITKTNVQENEIKGDSVAPAGTKSPMAKSKGNTHQRSRDRTPIARCGQGNWRSPPEESWSAAGKIKPDVRS